MGPTYHQQSPSLALEMRQEYHKAVSMDEGSRCTSGLLLNSLPGHASGQHHLLLAVVAT